MLAKTFLATLLLMIGLELLLSYWDVSNEGFGFTVIAKNTTYSGNPNSKKKARSSLATDVTSKSNTTSKSTEDIFATTVTPDTPTTVDLETPTSNIPTTDTTITSEESKSTTNKSTSTSITFSSSLQLEKDIAYCDVVRRSRLYSEECNHGVALQPRRLLVTSTGRSGTGFLENLLRDVGLQVSHDNRDRWVENSPHGAVSWVHAFSDDPCPYPVWAWRRRHLKKHRHNKGVYDHRNFLHVIHIVRDPLMTIRSRWNMGDIKQFSHHASCNTAAALFNKDGQSKKEYSLRQTLRHWVLHNSFIEAYTNRRFKTEDLSGEIVETIYNITVDTSSVQISGEFKAELAPLNPMKMSAQKIDQLLEAEKGGSHSNSGHTRKPNSTFTWDMLDQLDHDYTVQAQLMAIRYGYPIDEEIVKQNQLDQQIQICGFLGADQNYKWTCRLKKPDEDKQEENNE